MALTSRLLIDVAEMAAEKMKEASQPISPTAFRQRRRSRPRTALAGEGKERRSFSRLSDLGGREVPFHQEFRAAWAGDQESKVAWIKLWRCLRCGGKGRKTSRSQAWNRTAAHVINGLPISTKPGRAEDGRVVESWSRRVVEWSLTRRFRVTFFSTCRCCARQSQVRSWLIRPTRHIGRLIPRLSLAVARCVAQRRGRRSSRTKEIEEGSCLLFM